MTSADRPATCQARQWSDEMVCAACRLRWDMNDPEPPKCAEQKQEPANVRVFPRWKTFRGPR